MRAGGSGVPTPNIAHFNATLHACATGGAVDEALALLAEMEGGAGPGGRSPIAAEGGGLSAAPRADERSYQRVIDACERAGRTADARGAKSGLYKLQLGDVRDIDVNRRTNKKG